MIEVLSTITAAVIAPFGAIGLLVLGVLAMIIIGPFAYLLSKAIWG